MRKLSGLLMTMALMAVVASSASAAGKCWLGLVGGAAVPTGDFADAANTGFDVGGTGTYMLNDQWGVGVDGVYHMWNASDDVNAAAQVSTGDPSAEVKFSAIQGTGHLMYMMPMQGTMHPWLKGGLGVYNVKTKLDATSGSGDTSESNFGFNVGGGFNYAVNATWSLGVGAAYHMIQTDPDATNLFTVNANILWGSGGSK